MAMPLRSIYGSITTLSNSKEACTAYGFHSRAFVDTEVPVYAPLQKIESLKAQPIANAYLDIEESQLNSQGFHYPPRTKH